MKTILITAFLVSTLSIAYTAESKKADAQAVDAACTQDAATANCGTEKVGTGLMKCLHAYKKANKTYKFSDSCTSAMKQMHMDKKAKHKM